VFLEPGHIAPLQASLLAAIISAAGLLSMAMLGDWGKKYSPTFSAFAVGIMLTATLLHLIPEGFAQSEQLWQWISLGLLAFILSGLFLRLLSSGQSIETDLSFAFSSAFALGTHSLLDGVLYAMAFQGDNFTGWVAVIGLLVHEFPEGVIIFFLLRDANLDRTSAFALAFITACLTTILGTLGTLNFLDFFAASVPVMTGITVGAFIYVMIFHLGPHASRAPGRQGYLAASAGVFLATLAIVLGHSNHIGHDHGHLSGHGHGAHDQEPPAGAPLDN